MLNKKYLVFDFSSILYFFLFLFYNFDDGYTSYNFIFDLIVPFTQIFVLIAIVYTLYRFNINKNKKKLLMFFVSYIALIIIYRLFLLSLLDVDLIDFYISYIHINFLENISIFFIILEMIILNIYYNYFFRESLIEIK